MIQVFLNDKIEKLNMSTRLHNCLRRAGIDTVALAYLVQKIGAGDDSYKSFCNTYIVDDSIDEDTYDEYKYDDCEDDFYYNSTTGTVSRHHIWNVTIHNI